MLARISFGYSLNDQLKKLDREAYEQLRLRVETMMLGEWKEGANEPPYYYSGSDIYIDMTEEGVYLANLGIPFEVKKFKGAYWADKRLPDRVQGPQSIVQISIPNLALLLIDEVTWLEDACTQDLQSHLDDKWRILAVCPPNSQRRPDYILGRTRE